mmetsp:Transcript_126646/g.352866  ORF Transcript_126646/g.352866 Transcript_126646/m.352866 type:complete len:102 (-) Transcript_126646:212-517(-)
MAAPERSASDPWLHPIVGYSGHPRSYKRPMVEKPNEVPMSVLLQRPRSVPASAGARMVASPQNPFGIRDYQIPGAPAHGDFVSSLHAPPGYIGFKPMRYRY